MILEQTDQRKRQVGAAVAQLPEEPPSRPHTGIQTYRIIGPEDRCMR